MLGIIMAGGQGSRLMPLTESRPKPMVEVLGRPVIDYVKEAMVQAGIDEIIVTTGYRGEQLGKHVSTWPEQSPTAGLKASINQESTPMGTAGSVGLLRESITSTCVVGSGDAVASFDIKALLDAHRKNKAKVTMALWEVEDPTEFGIVGLSSDAQGEVDGNLRSGFIRRFLEKPSREEAFSNVINAGLYILEPEVFEHIPEGEKFDFSKQLFPHLLNLGWPMYAQAIDGVWFDVGQPSELLRAQETLIRDYDRLPFTYPPSYRLLDGNLLAESASLRGRVNSSVVGPTCELGEGSEVRDSLIMEGCSIAASAKINQSILGRNVSVPEGVMVEDCVIGDGVQLEPASIYSNQRISQFD